MSPYRVRSVVTAVVVVVDDWREITGMFFWCINSWRSCLLLEIILFNCAIAVPVGWLLIQYASITDSNNESPSLFSTSDSQDEQKRHENLHTFIELYLASEIHWLSIFSYYEFVSTFDCLIHHRLDDSRVLSNWQSTINCLWYLETSMHWVPVQDEFVKVNEDGDSLLTMLHVSAES